MVVESKVILASKNYYTGDLLISYQIKCPVWVWYDILTHRCFSRNASSTRAIPCKTMRENTLKCPAIPTTFMKARKGMAANEPLSNGNQALSNGLFELINDELTKYHEEAEKLGMSKQDANILLLPFIHFDAIISGTDWKNFFKLRNNEAAKPDLHLLAKQMQDQYNGIVIDEERNLPHENNNAWILTQDEWHTPYVSTYSSLLAIDDLELLKKISVAQCARVSYGTDKLTKTTYDKDIELHDKLQSSGHYSPFEHIATPLKNKCRVDNYNSWLQYRSFVETCSDDLSYPVISRQDAIQSLTN